LLAASLFTIVSLLVSSGLYFFRTLPPKHNLSNNAVLSVLWILGLSFLTWNTGWTLGHRCLVSNWKTEAGIMVCRLYKACTAFTVTGLYVLYDQLYACNHTTNASFLGSLTTLLTLFLDITTYRKTTKLGQYNQMHKLDRKRSHPAISSPMPPQYEDFSGQRAEETGDLGDQKPYRVQESIEVAHFGYSAPTEQTRYDPAHGMQ
ncbi:MAG: hypothetical protein LQ338_007198, partial [Usnochroma carphineum]